MTIVGSYPLQGTLQNLTMSVEGLNPYPVVGDSATLRFDLANPRATDVSVTLETSLPLLATGDFLPKLASVAYQKKNGNGNWVAVTGVAIAAGATMEMKAVLAFSALMDGTELGTFEVGYTEV